MTDVEWISVKDRLPEAPADEVLAKEYLVTLKSPDAYNYERNVTTLYFVGGDYPWEDINCEKYPEVLAWAELPEPYDKKIKYRWRLNPAGYGSLRDVYLTAISPVSVAFPLLTVAEWDIPVDKCNYKNIFTEEEYYKLSEYWVFDENLFIKEELNETEEVMER